MVSETESRDVPHPNSKLRLFVAIDPDETTRDAVSRLAQPNLRGLSRTAPHQLHLTLRFIGSVDEKQRPEIERALTSIRAERFQLSVEGVGAFPVRRPPRVVWVGAQSNRSQLLVLRQRVDEALFQCGIALESRPFHPHLTIGRISKSGFGGAIAEFLRQNATFKAPPFQVCSFILYKSELSSQGAIHTRLLTVPLTATELPSH